MKHSYLSPPRDDDSADNVDRRLLGDWPLGEWLLLLLVVLLVLLVFLFLVVFLAAVVVVSLWRLINPHTAKDWCEGSEMEEMEEEEEDEEDEYSRRSYVLVWRGTT